jgi:hypothetical protein
MAQTGQARSQSRTTGSEDAEGPEVLFMTAGPFFRGKTCEYQKAETTLCPYLSSQKKKFARKIRKAQGNSQPEGCARNEALRFSLKFPGASPADPSSLLAAVCFSQSLSVVIGG